MSIKAMQKQCVYCGRSFAFNPSVGKIFCPRPACAKRRKSGGIVISTGKSKMIPSRRKVPGRIQEWPGSPFA